MGTETTLSGKSVLVTGGTGTFGNAFVRRALEAGASRVCVFSRSESKQAQMAAELNDPRMRFFIGDVRDAERVKQAVRGVEYVIHAAALKRVDTCDEQPGEARRTNIDGTENVARACIECGVDRAIFLSTDKAAAPGTTYGASKLFAERLWLGYNVYSGGGPTRFAATRYGNVAGSTGSVIPKWRAQVAVGQAITVTDAGCSRFWMRIGDAVDLVLLALGYMRGGDVFVPKLGSATNATLAAAVAPGAPITYTGLGDEKLHETLVSAEESRRTYDAGTHYVIEPYLRTWGSVPPLPHPFVTPGFEYRSDTNERQLSVTDLRRMVG